MRELFFKELRGQLLSTRFFALASVFTLLSGISFFSLLNRFNPLVEQSAMVPNQAVSLNDLVIAPYWAALAALLLFLIPVLSMRTFAAEREERTFPLLLAAPISSLEIVVAKLIPLFLSVAVLLLLQAVFPLLLFTYADFEILPAAVGLCGVIALALFSLALGAAVSAFSPSQITACALTFLLLFGLHSLQAFASDFRGGLSEVFLLISPNRHLANLQKGLIVSGDVVYFLAIIALAAFVAAERIELERGA